MGILDFNRVPDKALPDRLQDTALNATYAPKNSPSLTGAPTLNGVPIATTDDAFINSLIFGS